MPCCKFDTDQLSRNMASNRSSSPKSFASARNFFRAKCSPVFRIVADLRSQKLKMNIRCDRACWCTHSSRPCFRCSSFRASSAASFRSLPRLLRGLRAVPFALLCSKTSSFVVLPGQVMSTLIAMVLSRRLLQREELAPDPVPEQGLTGSPKCSALAQHRRSKNWFTLHPCIRLGGPSRCGR